MITEKWHDLRKNPADLPETSEDVWVILVDNPTKVDVDSYNKDDIGKVMIEPEINFTDGNGTKVHRDKVEYKSTGWYYNGMPGQITHWMKIEVPEPPEDEG